jgi:hypothetical protein
MARRIVEPPPDLAEAHLQFRDAVRAAYRAFMQAKQARGYCLSGSCMDMADPGRRLCKYHAMGQARWQRKQTQNKKARAMCELHGNYLYICGCHG